MVRELSCLGLSIWYNASIWILVFKRLIWLSISLFQYLAHYLISSTVFTSVFNMTEKFGLPEIRTSGKASGIDKILDAEKNSDPLFHPKYILSVSWASIKSTETFNCSQYVIGYTSYALIYSQRMIQWNAMDSCSCLPNNFGWPVFHY